MARIAGSLMAGMMDLERRGERIAVALIDEQSAPRDPATDVVSQGQRMLIAFAVRMGYSLFVIELNPTITGPRPAPNRRTHVGVRALLPPNTPVVTKPHLNAFDRTNLHALLQAQNITVFVVAGFETNCCVKRTAVGGPDGNEGPVKPGATQHGYTVASCSEILRGQAPVWADDAGVLFYSKI